MTTIVSMHTYVELQRELGSLIALRDGLRVGTHWYHGGGEFMRPPIREHMKKAEEHIRQAIQVLENTLEDTQPN